MKSRIVHLGFALVLVAAVAAPVLGQPDIIRLDPVAPVYVPPLRDMEFAPIAPTGFNVEIPIRVVPGGSEVDTGVVFSGMQTALTGVPSPGPLVNFLGQSDDDNAVVVGTRIVPPDTDGGIGATQYLQWINLIAEIYDRNGNSVLGPFPGNAFFAGVGGPCQNGNSGDPQTIYDQKNNRWVVSQFAPNNGLQCVAVSLTSDATGAYFVYVFTILGFNDYPKMGLWLNNTNDTLSFTYRNFGGPGGGVSLDFQIADYARMINGLVTTSFIVRGGAPFQEGTLPVDVDGSTYPAGDQALFGRINNAGTAYEIFAFDGNFGGGAPTFGQIANVAIGPIDRGVGRIPQPAPGEPLDDHSQFTMHRAAYREIGGGSQLLANATADAGGDVGAQYWADLRGNAGGQGGWGLNDEGVYSPSPQVGPRLERWMGSIAGDKNGNIAVGYSASSSVSQPSVRTTGRMAGDPAGMLRDEIVVQPGGGVQQASANRWGDYSNMSVDPLDDCTFWYTQEYYANSGSFDFKTRISSFRFSDCGATPAAPTITQTGGSCPGNVTVSGTGFTPNQEALFIRAANLNGFIKGGPLCNALVMEVGEPFNLPPQILIANGSGNISGTISTSAGFCFLEAADPNGGCRSSNAINTD